ncbi:restriction endonuclease subunit S [Propionibacteriaceae bacterium G57]|uniref:restriction endonuclease subunit S n=1 Tax=Aestuariimicrobium sp. G57 TaxID=3418485 RepID=UPI003DA7227F
MKTVPLHQVAEIRLGRQRSPEHYAGNHVVPYLRSANVVDGALDLSDVNEMNFSPEEQSIFALRPGDVLITEGSGSADSVGASAVWQGQLAGVVCFQNTLLRLRPRTDRTDGRYLAWWARHSHGSGQFSHIASGANIRHLGADNLRRMRVSWPDVEAQRRIADFLDDRVARIDRIIAARRQQVELVDDPASLADLILTQSDWEHTSSLGRFIDSIEQGWSPQCESVPAGTEEWGVLKVSAVKAGMFLPEENKLLPPNEEPRLEYEVKAGDLLVTRANTPRLVGAFAVAPEDVRPRLILCDKIMRLALAGDVEPGFVALVGQSKRTRDALSMAGTGTSQSMVNIRGDDIRGLAVPLLSLATQQERMEGWKQLRASTEEGKALLQRSIDLLTEYKTSLITAAVTGELDITTASRRIPGE